MNFTTAVRSAAGACCPPCMMAEWLCSYRDGGQHFNADGKDKDTDILLELVRVLMQIKT